MCALERQLARARACKQRERESLARANTCAQEHLPLNPTISSHILAIWALVNESSKTDTISMNSCKSSWPFTSISGKREEEDERKSRGERGERNRKALERQNAALDLRSSRSMLERRETVFKHVVQTVCTVRLYVQSAVCVAQSREHRFRASAS